MKKIILISLLIIGCKKEVVTTKTSEPTKDCSCDRVAKVFTYNIVDGKGGVIPYAEIWTVNDCTNLTKNTKESFGNYQMIPKVGDCYEMPY